MTRRNYVKAHWYYYRVLENMSFHQMKFGEEFIDWIDCMAHARSAEESQQKAIWLSLAAMHRNNMKRKVELQHFFDNYGKLP